MIDQRPRAGERAIQAGRILCTISPMARRRPETPATESAARAAPSRLLSVAAMFGFCHLRSRARHRQADHVARALAFQMHPVRRHPRHCSPVDPTVPNQAAPVSPVCTPAPSAVITMPHSRKADRRSRHSPGSASRRAAPGVSGNTTWRARPRSRATGPAHASSPQRADHRSLYVPAAEVPER